jgi:hypothetical protein
MTDTPAQAATPTAPVAGAIETLVAELEREQAWLGDLRADTERSERSCQRLLKAVEAALGALPVEQRRPFYLRVMRQRVDTPRMGRPPRDGRQAAVLDFLAERGEGPVSNAEVRAHLRQHGLKDTVEYVGSLLHTLQKEEVVMRLSMGRYAINAAHPRLRAARWRRIAEARVAVARSEGELMQAQAGLRA